MNTTSFLDRALVTWRSKVYLHLLAVLEQYVDFYTANQIAKPLGEAVQALPTEILQDWHNNPELLETHIHERFMDNTCLTCVFYNKQLKCSKKNSTVMPWDVCSSFHNFELSEKVNQRECKPKSRKGKGRSKAR